MFGDDGWCRGCAVPLREQSGSLVLQRRGLASLGGAWTPYWRHDVICLGEGLAQEISSRFDVSMRDVAFPRPSSEQVKQIEIPVSVAPWFAHDELAARAVERNGASGAACAMCGTWRWMPVADLPEVHAQPSWKELDVVASPEWFGDGCRSFREILVRRGLAELIAKASPRDFSFGEANVKPAGA